METQLKIVSVMVRAVPVEVGGLPSDARRVSYDRTMSVSGRVNISKQAPAAYKAMGGLAEEVGRFTDATGLERALVELVKLRISQINGCAFCLDLHHGKAVGYGEDPRRLAVLAAWRETDLFSTRERAALQLAEAVTTISQDQVPDEVYDSAAEVLDDDELAAVVWLAVTMNAFNRIAVTSRYPVK